MLLRKTTLTSQVASILERRILSGKFAAGRRMPSTRDLARDFGVSQQVVKSAVAEMEGRKLVTSRSRDGVYVNPKALSPARREFAILSCGGGHVENYLARVLRLDDSSVWGGVNLLNRSISMGHAGGPLLEYELERVKEARPDCLLAFTPFRSEAELKPFSSLQFPVVFIGDFAWDTPRDSKWNQIVEDTAERAQVSAQAALKCGARDIVMIGGALTHSYSRMLKAAATKECAKAGAKFKYIEFTESSCESLADLAERRRECVKSILKERRPDAALLDGFSHVDIFAKELEGSGALLINDRELCPGTVFIASDYKPFAEAARKLIESLVENPGAPIGRVMLRGLIRRNPVRVETV